MKRSLLVLALAAACVPATAVYGIQTGPDSVDTTFQWVGRVGNNGSGTVIAPNWVLTASHVRGNTFTLNGVTYTAAEVYDHPTSDLWLMRFNHTFGGFYPIFDGPLQTYEVHLVGFGNSATYRSDHLGYNPLPQTDPRSFGIRRSATNRIEASGTINFDFGGATGARNFAAIAYDLDYHSEMTPVGPYRNDIYGGGGATSNEGGILPGDSGGAWLVDVGGGDYRLIGVSSLIGTAASTPPVPPGGAGPATFGLGIGIAVDLTAASNKDWIVQTVPEPGTMIALGLSAAALAFRRRRRPSK